MAALAGCNAPAHRAAFTLICLRACFCWHGSGLDGGEMKERSGESADISVASAAWRNGEEMKKMKKANSGERNGGRNIMAAKAGNNVMASNGGRQRKAAFHRRALGVCVCTRFLRCGALSSPRNAALSAGRVGGASKIIAAWRWHIVSRKHQYRK